MVEVEEGSRKTRGSCSKEQLCVVPCLVPYTLKNQDPHGNLESRSAVVFSFHYPIYPQYNNYITPT